ncbi:albumin-2-like [Vicia villosa]|uniref:albumin-2-like n=1 Tax=Vicia villosa TaxID=3911 RepID=UPI00273B83EE|nr:albumin-2-like [Vicia villosa]
MVSICPVMVKLRLTHPRCQRADNSLIINRHFNPLSDPTTDLLLIQMPVYYYYDQDRVRRVLRHETYPPLPPPGERQKRQVSNTDSEAALKWYGTDVTNALSYIDAAFRSSYTNEAYIFIKNEYVLLNYAPHSTGDKILNGPLLICDGFPSLIGTAFGEYGIDSAFDTDDNKAFIFSTNLCAYMDYAPRTTDDKILSGPMKITDMFPFFKNTVFESGIDTAFRSSVGKEVYLFRGDKYALINYDSKNLINNIQKITDGFPSLIGTVFASGIDASFASHKYNEAYIFKGELYALINFAPHTTDDYLVDGRVKPILPNWPSLRSILPHNNAGLDDHHHQDEDHDDV